jgi:hypothetical protein
MINWLAPKLDVGIMRNNRYISTASTSFFRYSTKQVPEATRLSLSFEQYQRITNNEQGSSVVNPTTEWAKNLEPQIVVNETGVEKTITYGEEWWQADGKKGPAVLQLAPYSSQIIWQKKTPF